MSTPAHSTVPGASYFVTTKCWQGGSLFQVSEVTELLINLIKGGSSYRIHKERGNRMEIWQVGFHDWTLRDGEDWKAKANYIHMNPVKARLCECAEDWSNSSLNGRVCLDSVPEKYTNLAVVAKAQDLGAVTQGLEPLLPKDGADPDASAGTVAGVELTPLVSKEPGS